MPLLRAFLTFPLAFVIAASPAAAGQQQHVVGPDQLATTVTDSVAKQDAKRATVHEALARPEVEEAAAKLGLDLARAGAAVDAMNGADLEKAADAAQQVNEQLVGGSNISISTTTLIIILLLIIILIVAIK